MKCLAQCAVSRTHAKLEVFPAQQTGSVWWGTLPAPAPMVALQLRSRFAFISAKHSSGAEDAEHRGIFQLGAPVRPDLDPHPRGWRLPAMVH